MLCHGFHFVGRDWDFNPIGTFVNPSPSIWEVYWPWGISKVFYEVRVGERVEMPMAKYHSASSVRTYASCFRQVTSYTPGTFFPHPRSSGPHIFTSRLGFTCHPPCISSSFFTAESMAPVWRSTKRDKTIHFLPPWHVVYSLRLWSYGEG